MKDTCCSLAEISELIQPWAMVFLKPLLRELAKVVLVSTRYWWLYNGDRFKLLVKESVYWRLYWLCWWYWSVINLLPKSQIGHQHLKVVTKIRHQHRHQHVAFFSQQKLPKLRIFIISIFTVVFLKVLSIVSIGGFCKVRFCW